MESAEISRNDMQWWITQKLKSRNPASRRQAVESLGEEEDPRHVQLLTASLSDRDVEVRVAAVHALSRIDGASALPSLLAALTDPEPAVRESCALSFKNVGDQQAIPNLIPLLKDSDASVRAAAAQSLQQIGWEPTDPREQVQLLVALGEYQQAAALGDSALDALIDALRDNSHFTRRFALEALARLDDNRVGPVLTDCLSDPDSQIRVAAAEELAHYQGDEYVVALSQALGDPEPMLRAAAASSLSRMGNPTCVPFLMERLKDDHWIVRKASVDALGHMGCPEALDELATALNDPDHVVREATVIAMKRIGDQRAVEYLVEALADTASSVRSAAASALSALDPDWQRSEGAQKAVTVQEAVSQVKQDRMQHTDDANAIRTNDTQRPSGADPGPGRAGSSSKRVQVLEILVHAMDDFDRDIRLAAAEALGRLQEESCAGPLSTLLEDPDEWVQVAAGKALHQVTHQQPVKRADGQAMITA